LGKCTACGEEARSRSKKTEVAIDHSGLLQPVQCVSGF
jgi:hypothetical protein